MTIKYSLGDDHITLERNEIVISRVFNSHYSEWSCRELTRIEITKEVREVFTKLIDKANKWDQMMNLILGPRANG